MGQSEPFRLKVLVVDDDPDVLKIASAALAGEGHSVFSAATGREALAILDGDSDIKLLFTDIVMPGSMDGFDLAEAAKAKRPGLRVIYTSGYLKDEGVWDGPLLRKPWTKDELTRTIADLYSSVGHRTGAERRLPHAQPPGSPPSRERGTLAHIYRAEAKRLLGLAASAGFEDARLSYLELARRYEALAERVDNPRKPA